MSNTSNLNIANIQVYAEAAAEADRANGTFNANFAADRYYYLWQGEHQTIPMGMNGNPEQFVDRMLDAIPGLNALRVPFNINSFNPDGSLAPEFERFLIAAASRGLQLIPVLADGGAQQFDGTTQQIQEALVGPVFDDMVNAWQKMKSWMEDHPSVEAAVYGWELVNEPASYDRAINRAPAADRADVQQDMVALYIQHMAELARIVSADSDARILVSAWGYGGDTSTLANTMVGGVTAIDALRSTIGPELVWSLHFYPGWMGTDTVTSPEALQDVWRNFISPLGPDDILMTEINANGWATFNPFQADQINTWTALSLSWLAEQGIGIGWFPAVQTGSSGLAFIERDGGIRYLNQASLATALDGFSSGENPSDRAGNERVDVILTEARLRNQIGDADYARNRIDVAEHAGVAFGYAGDDTLFGSDFANNFLYGGFGDDILLGNRFDDFLFGQEGNDFIVSGAGVDNLFGGAGCDTIIGDSINNTAYGGADADLFVLRSSSRMVVSDYSQVEGDSWSVLDGITLSETRQGDLDGDGNSDFILVFSDMSELVFLTRAEI